MKYPKTGLIQIVPEKEVHALTSQGWSLLEVLSGSEILYGLEKQPQPMSAAATIQTYNTPMVPTMRAFVGRANRFVMHLEQGSLNEQLSAKSVELEAKSQEWVKLEAELKRDYQSQTETLEKLRDKWKGLSVEMDSLKKENNELGVKAATLSALVTPLLEDLSRCFKALGKDRVREILGREIEDPYPTPEDQIKNTYQRLLENEDENNQTG
jgi:predicted RNase H-like nuclease (RuvC/YqgF family)